MISNLVGAFKMTKQQFGFNAIAGALCGLVTWLVGGWDVSIRVLAAFMVLDYVMGYTRSWIQKKTDSEVGFNGIVRKMTIFVVVMVGALVDRVVGNSAWLFRTIAIYFFISNEGISLLENCASLGVPIPDKIVEALIQLKEGNKKELKKKENEV